MNGKSRGSIKNNRWPNGVLVYEITSSLCKSHLKTSRKCVKSLFCVTYKHTCLFDPVKSRSGFSAQRIYKNMIFEGYIFRF